MNKINHTLNDYVFHIPRLYDLYRYETNPCIGNEKDNSFPHKNRNQSSIKICLKL